MSKDGTGSSAPQQGSQEHTRARLISAATQLFALQGFDGTSVKAIADLAGVNVSLVSYHFGGKENLYRACLEEFGKERLDLAQRVLQPAKSLEEFKLRLGMFAEELFAAHVEKPDCACILHRENDMEMPVAQEVFRTTFIKVFETLATYIDQGQRSGFVQKSLSPLLTATTLFGSMIHTLRSDKLGERYFGKTVKDPVHRKQVVEHIIHQNLYGMLAPSSERNSSS